MTAYMIVQTFVTDLEKMEEYKALAAPAVAKHGGKYLSRGGPMEDIENEWDAPRVTLLEFPSVEAAKTFYNSPDYQEAKSKREGAARFIMTILEAT
jgi:uncharacterized protein (DUF1330 family)